MPALPDAQTERALVIVAHPDDAEFWAGGTIARWTDAGIGVTYCIVTDGAGGGFDPATPRADIPAIRRAEQRAAAELLGVTEIRFLGLPEGGLRPASCSLHTDLVRIIRQIRPQRVLTWSPEWNCDIGQAVPAQRQGTARSVTIFPGSWTDRDGRHRAKAPERPRSRPVARSASASSSPPAWGTIPVPSADTTILGGER
jgi:hypothetical protein